MNKICPICKIDYHTYPSINAKTCSASCAGKLKTLKHKDKHERSCVICGDLFVPKRTDTPGLYCSYVCLGVSNRKDTVNRSGYDYKMVPEHPNSNKYGYIPVHHLVMEEYLGRYLEKGEVVHHCDSVKNNNQLENLELMLDSYHRSFHAKRRKRGKMALFL